jgi:carboxymethylenebutenolidase
MVISRAAQTWAFPVLFSFITCPDGMNSTEIARRLTQHGYMVICPTYIPGLTWHPKRSQEYEQGGVPDDVVKSTGKAMMALSRPNCNGKVGVIGGCSGGRHAFLVACRAKGFNAVVNCWGGRVIVSREELTPQTPVAPVDYIENLTIPLLGLFGNDDQNPSPEKVNQLEAELKKLGKNYEFHRYDGAGHAFWSYDRPAYRQQQAMDAWEKTFSFFSKHLKS